MVDISRTAIKEYIDQFPDKFKEDVVNIICDGEAFVNSFESQHGQILLDVLSEHYVRQIKEMLALIKTGQYENDEELRRIRQHCVAINQLFTLIKDWGAKLNQFNRHLVPLTDKRPG